MTVYLEVEPYVNYHIPKPMRSILAQLKIGFLPLHVDT